MIQLWLAPSSQASTPTFKNFEQGLAFWCPNSIFEIKKFKITHQSLTLSSQGNIPSEYSFVIQRRH